MITKILGFLYLLLLMTIQRTIFLSRVTPRSEVVWRVLATHCIRQFPPSLPLPCVTVCHHISTAVYHPTQTPLTVHYATLRPRRLSLPAFPNLNEILNWPPTVRFHLYSHELWNRKHCSFCDTGGLVCQRSASENNRPNYDVLHCSPATGHLDTVCFLGFPVSISKRSDGSQHPKLPLHASHVALRT